MKMPASEVIDRYTITKIRTERTTIDTAEELSLYEESMPVAAPELLSDFIATLYEVNLELWIVEEDIFEIINLTAPDYEKIGHLAMQVRDLNWKRNRIKEEISSAFDKTTLSYSKVKYGRT